MDSSQLVASLAGARIDWIFVSSGWLSFLPSQIGAVYQIGSTVGGGRAEGGGGRHREKFVSVVSENKKWGG